MKPLLVILSVLALTGIAIAGFKFIPRQTTPLDEQSKTIYGFGVTTITHKKESLSEYKNKVVMVVNVASKCGNTPQYEPLEAMYRKYKDQGFVVLGFPCNQFSGQEPGTEEEIAEFCKATYDVSFPMFAKVDVKGDEAHPLYKFLVNSTENKKDIEWNFAKFLIGKDGQVIARYGARTKPDDATIIAALEKALAE